MQRLKLGILRLAKILGLFRLAKYLTRRELNILCYHGFSLADEHEFRPKLFMRAATFEARLVYLKTEGFNVLPLPEALERLADGSLPHNSIAITLDDGWQGAYSLAWPLLQQYQMPWMLYLTTYYVVQQMPVANIAIQYLLWKTRVPRFELAGLVPGQQASAFLLEDARQKAAVTEILVRHCDSLPTAQRPEFLAKLAQLAQVDWPAHERLFYLIDAHECRVLHESGVAIELHTHRHYLPKTSRAEMLAELEENSSLITQLCGAKPRHFCYPSGAYTEEQVAWLEDSAILSATTCDAGFNSVATSPYKLARFLDGENISQIEFEAEVSGFKYLLRKLKRS